MAAFILPRSCEKEAEWDFTAINRLVSSEAAARLWHGMESDRPAPVADRALLSELADRLQSAGMFVAAARRLTAGGKGDDRTIANVIETASRELTRANATFGQLRAQHLLARKSEAAGCRSSAEVRSIPARSGD